VIRAKYANIVYRRNPLPRDLAGFNKDKLLFKVVIADAGPRRDLGQCQNTIRGLAQLPSI
jgi:hypothetical protein